MSTATTAPIGSRRLPVWAQGVGFRRALGVALLLAVGWWLVGLGFGALTGVQPWADQRTTFTQAVHHLADPYPALAWPYVPWTALLLAPFGLLPWQFAVLVQMLLYFAILTALIFKFEGGFWTVVLVLTSAIAFDTALEINIEWLVCLGLLLPPAWSGPLLLVKPQVALGYGLSFDRWEIVRAGVVVLAVVIAALILWPGWPDAMLADIRQNTLGSWGATINIAPVELLSTALPDAVARVLAYGGGLALGLLAFRRKDVVLGVLAWLLVVPYATFYSLMPAYALAATRWPKVALIFSLTTWALYAIVLLPFLAAV
jgi:hypothetical protein